MAIKWTDKKGDKGVDKAVEQAHEVAGPEKTGRGRPSNKEHSQKVLSEMLASGELDVLSPVSEEGEDEELWTRREQVWRLHLKGLNKEVIGKFFGISRQTVHHDLRRFNERMQGELGSMGPAGVITKSYLYYEHARDEVMRLLADVGNAQETAEGAAKAGLGQKVLSGFVQDKAMLLRLAKDIEDSKMRMMMTIGLVPRKRTQAPKMGEDAGTDELTSEDVLSIVQGLKDALNAD